MVQWVKNPPAMQETEETWVPFLSQKIPWMRKWQLTPVFLPEKSHGHRSLVGYSPKGHKELDMTEWLSTSVQFSHSVVSDSLRPHESQHARPPCPSPPPGVHPNSYASSQWCHPAISSSVVPSPPAPNPSQHQGLFQWVNSSHKVAKYWSFSLSISPSNEHPGLVSFRMDWLDLLAVQGTLKSLLQHHSWKASILWRSAFFIVHTWPLEKP